MFTLALGLGGPYDIAIIAVVVLVLFGGAKLADFAKSAGQGIREFKKAATDDPQQQDQPTATPPAAAPPAANPPASDTKP